MIRRFLLLSFLASLPACGHPAPSRVSHDPTPTRAATRTPASDSAADALGDVTPKEVTQPSRSTGAQAIVATDHLNLRAGPGTDYIILTTLARGDTLDVLAFNADQSWARVDGSQGDGWLSTAYVELEGDSTLAPNHSPLVTREQGSDAAVTQEEPAVLNNPTAATVVIPPSPAAAPTAAAPSTSGAARVVNIVDGDTIDVEMGGVIYRVRYIGMDTPERGAPFFSEATEANAALVAGRDVWLEKDVSESDRYDRLLRYVWVGSLMVNEELVRQGVAQVATYPPDVAYVDRLLAVQQRARSAGAGLWLSPPTEPPPPPPPAPPAPAQTCDPSYPTVCITPKSQVGDLDCGQISFRRFQVLSPDPHGFDGDNDGIGCESG